MLSRLAPTLNSSAVMRSSGTSTVSSVNVTSDTTANTKGAWTEIIASTSIEADGFTVFLEGDTFNANNAGEALVDFGIGAAASETVVVADLRLGRRDINDQQRPQIYVPVRVPAGSRVAARAQSAAGADVFAIGVDLFGGSKWGQQRGYARCSTVGADLTDSGGEPLATPAGVNTKGAWTAVTSSSPVDAKAMLVLFGCAGDNTFANANTLFDVAVGGAGSEQVIIADMEWKTGTSEVYYSYLPGSAFLPIRCDIPAGARISARYASTSLNNDWDAIIYLFS